MNDSSMAMAMKDSLSQGSQYLNVHKGQYGGSAAYPAAVMSSSLPSSMIPAARTGPLDAAISSIQGMQDGGRRGRSHKRSSHKRSSRKRSSHKRSSHKRSSHKRSRKHSRKHRGRKHRGGASLMGSPLSSSSMILPSGMEKAAALNYEWSLAKDPNSFVPNTK